MHVVALSGGVGGAKLADGLADHSSQVELTVVVNTGDDFRRYGLHISPDVDTVLYTLSGRADSNTGWGLAGDTDHVLRALVSLGDDPWFKLGDRDLATHLLRTQMLHGGSTLTQCTRRMAEALSVGPAVLPMTDEPVATQLLTDDGWTDFQSWFVQQSCEPPARDVRYLGAENATASRQVIEVVGRADAIIICPSNPYLSIGPILALAGFRSSVIGCGAPVVAVSPIVAGKALKGPTATMLSALAGESSNMAIAQFYGGLLDGLVIDEADADNARAIEDMGVTVAATDIVMRDRADRRALAGHVLELVDRLTAASGSS